MQNRLSHYGEVPLCYITWALQDMEMKQMKTAEQGFVPNWNLTNSEHTHAYTPLLFKTL